MSAARRLIGLYPRPFREQWGEDIEREVHARGARSWPNLARGIVDSWLHPMIWPADTDRRRRARASVMAIATTATCWYLIHFAAEMDPRFAAGTPRAAGLNACMLLMLAGLALVAPRPRLNRHAAVTMLAQLVRGFALPAGLAAAVAIWAPTATGAPPALRFTALITWYGALALAAVQSCRIAAQLGRLVAEPPRRGPLRIGLYTLTAADAGAGGIIASAAVANHSLHPLATALGPGVLALTAATLATLRDLGRLPGPRTT